MRLVVFTILLSFVFVGCKSKKEVSNSSNANTQIEVSPTEENAMVIAPMDYHKASLAGIRRTYCFGTCPVYSMYLLKDFTLVYEGKKNVEKIGKFMAKASQEDYEQLLTFADEINYLDLEDSYVAEVSDLPTTYTTLVREGERKTIVNLFMAPDQLTEFEAFFDNLFMEKEWQEVDEF